MILSRVGPFVGNSDTDRSGSKQGLPIAAKCENVGYATKRAVALCLPHKMSSGVE